jgi:hypothetical protein
MTRALRSLRPLRDLAPVVETVTAWTRFGPVESRIYHDHAARVALARAAQRIGRVETVSHWVPPRRMTTALVVPCPPLARP